MNQLHKPMRRRKFNPAGPLSVWLFLLLSFGVTLAGADDLVTREYRLKNAEASNIIQVLNFTIKNPTGKRIMGGQAKRLVVTDAIEPQDDIAQLLPILDQPSTETDPRKIQMEMVVRASHFLQERKKSQQVAQKSNAAASPSAADSSVKTNSYDVRLSTRPYKSVYSDEDAKLMKKPHVIHDEPALPSLSALILKGIFRENTKSPLALLSYEGINYTARDGGLFATNRDRLKGVVTQIKKDRVILTGPDRIPREIGFKSTL